MEEVVVTPDPIRMEVGVEHRAVVTLLDARGLPLDDRQVEWSVTDPTVATVAADGVVTSRAVGSTTLTATAEGVFGSTAVEVLVSASRDASVCALVGTGWESHTERSFSQPSLGTLNVLMLFADFTDAPATESTSSLYDLLIPTAQDWFSEVSQGRFSISVDRVDEWFRAPQASGTYDWRTFDGHKTYISQIMGLADATVDFGPYDAVFIIASRGTAQPVSPTFHAIPGNGVTMDGVEIRSAVTFGEDVRLDLGPSYGAFTAVHETGHIVGLPDLYLFDAGTWLSSMAAVGMWDPMAFQGLGTHLVAWHKWKLGWMDEDRLDCLGPATVERTLVPFDSTTGLQAVVIPTSGEAVLVVEVRRARGFDSEICEEGVLVYAVNVNVGTGRGPVRVRSARSDRDTSRSNGDACGPLYESSYGLGGDRISSHVDASGITVELIEDFGDAYRVRITRN